MSKGSRRRPTDEAKFRENYERIFGDKPIKGRQPGQRQSLEKKHKDSQQERLITEQ